MNNDYIPCRECEECKSKLIDDNYIQEEYYGYCFCDEDCEEKFFQNSD